MATATQRSDLRADFGLADDETVFTNTEVDRLFVRAGERYTATDSIEAYARVLACKQLRGKAANLTDYTQNETTEKLSQIFANLTKMQHDFEVDLAAAERAGSASVRIGALKKKPTRLKDYPDA
jgi:hypothetical protein